MQLCTAHIVQGPKRYNKSYGGATRSKSMCEWIADDVRGIAPPLPHSSIPSQKKKKSFNFKSQPYITWSLLRVSTNPHSTGTFHCHSVTPFGHFGMGLDRSQSVFYFVPQENQNLTVKQARLDGMGLFSGLWKFENVKHSFCATIPSDGIVA